MVLVGSENLGRGERKRGVRDMKNWQQDFGQYKCMFMYVNMYACVYKYIFMCAYMHSKRN